MKNRMFKSLATMLFIGFFVASFASVNITDGAEDSFVIKGTIVSVNTTTGQVVVKAEVGNNLRLVAGHETDLTTYKEGDHVIIECSNDGVIKSINKRQ